MYRDRIIKNFLNYLTSNGVSNSSLRFYKSDIVNFLNWANGRKVNKDLVNEYINSQRLITPVSTLNRRLSTIRSFASYLGDNFMDNVGNISSFKKVTRSWQEALLSKFENKPKLKNIFSKLFFSRPNWYKKYHSYALSSYLHFAILILFASTAGYATYDQFFSTTNNLFAFPSALTRPNRYLSFQGRLTDDLGNPETVATNVVFKLYDVSSGGVALWDSGTCSITPDQDGIFSTLLGSSCGAEIASSVFSENAAIWLGVTVGADAEATPRIQIATVAYALNSETLQGFPAGTGTSTIPYINSSGVVVLANASPKIQSTSGTFAVEGQALTLTTPDTTNGSITINPDGTGTLNLTFEGTSAGGGANGFVNATNANITSGSLYSGTVASNATGYNFINFLSGATPTSKFSVDSTGLTNIGADLYVASGISTFGTAVSDGTIEATKFCTGDGETNCVTDFSSLGGGGSLFTDSGTVTYLTSTTDDLAIGGSTILASMFGLDESAGNFYFGYDNSANPTLNFEATDGDAGEFGFNTNDAFYFSNANVGIGETNPTAQLQVAGTTAITGGATFPTGVEGLLMRYSSSTGYLYSIVAGTGVRNLELGASTMIFKTGSGITPSEKMRLTDAGNLGIGTTGPDAKIDSLATSGEQLRLTYTDGSVYSGFTVDANGYLAIDPTGARIALDGSLQIGGTSPLAYSRFGTATTGHAGNITASDDLLISGDLELNGSLFLDSGIIANSAGLQTIVFSSTPTTTPNTLTGGNWLVENTTGGNVGQAALMINNTKSGDLLTASASGTTKFTVQNDGDVLLTNQLQLGNLASTPTAVGPGSMYFNTTTNTNQCYNGTNWYNCGGTLYSNTNSVADGAYITVSHNLANSDLLSNAWIDTHGNWKLLDATYKPAIAWEGKDTQKGVYHNNINTYIQGSETGAVSATLNEGLVFDTFEDSTKTDSANTTVSTTAQTGDDGSTNFSTLNQRIQSGRVGLMGGQTYSTSTTDNDGQTYLGNNTVNDMYYYDRAKDSVPEVLVELGIDPNWYNGVTLSVATSSASYSQNGTLAEKNPNLTTRYNGSLIKATGTDSTPRTIYITIKSPTTFDWTNYQGDSATGVTITTGTAQTLGSTGVSVTFTGGVSYNVGDVFKIASWYIEPESATRGVRQQFPERSYIIGSGTSSSIAYVDIIDADTQKLWMRFSSTNASNLLDLGSGATNGTITSVQMLNGQLYAGAINSAGSDGRLHKISFSSDNRDVYYSTAGIGIYRYNGSISQREDGLSGQTVQKGPVLVTPIVNDVAAAVIPNHPTQEVTVSGWGYIATTATNYISQTVQLPYKFNDSPRIATAVVGTINSEPTSVESCTSGSSTPYSIQHDNITKSSFVTTTHKTDGTNFATGWYICYTWTATGTVSPKQFMAAATGATSTDGGTTIINDTDGTKATVLDGSLTVNTIWSSKLAFGGNTLYIDWSITTGEAIAIYKNIHALETESAVFNRRSGQYGFNGTTSPLYPEVLGSASSTEQVKSLTVTENTSTNHPNSNTIYVGTTSGLTIINEIQGNLNRTSTGTVASEEAFGSVKYYTKDYISEEMIGDIRGMWPLNNANASSDFEDVSIKGNVLTGTNITANGDSVSGVRNTATDFDGSTEYMACTDAACGGTTKLDFAATTSFTYGAWFKTNATGAFQTLLSKKATNSGLEAGYSLYINDTNQVVCRIADGTNGASATSTQTFTDGNWNHAACIVDRGASLIYLIINGQITTSASTSSVTSTLDNAISFNIGARNSSGNYFNGAIDEAFVTANTITASQIKNMYQTGYRALQSHSASLGSFSADGNQGLAGSSNVIGAAQPDYNNQYMYVGTNHISNGALSKIQLNSDTIIHAKTDALTLPSGGLDLISEDTTALAVGESLYAVGSATTGVLSMGSDGGIDGKATATSGNFVSKTFELPKNIGSAVLWVSPVLDSNDGSNTITVQASNDGGTNYVTCTLVGTDSNRNVPEREYACTFTTADNDLKVRFQFARGSSKTNTYITEYGISWLGETGFRVEQADNNNVRLYNFSGETQNLKLNVTGASTAALANPWTDAGSYLYASGYETLRIYDGAGTNYLGLSHDGTLANLTYNGTTVLSINSTGDLLPNTDDTQSLGSNTKRWKDLFVGGETIHIGTSLTDEGTIAYDTTNNIFQFDTDSTTNGDIAFFTDDLYLDKSLGNVGIGTTAPVFKFEVNSGATAPSSIDLTNTIAVGVGAANGTAKYLGQIGFASRDGNFTAPKLVAYISAEATENYAADIDTGSIMRFFTGANDGTSPVERMAIDNNGNIGIGITGQSNQRLRINAPSTLTAANNYGLFISGDQSTANTGNHVGINLNPTYSAASGNTLQGLQGIVSTPQNTSSGTVNYMYGINTVPQNSSTGTVTNMIGTHSVAQKTGTGAVTTAVAGWFRVDNTNATGTLTNAYALYIDDSTETGTITNDYGLYQVDASALNYFAGNLGVGTNSPSTVLHAQSASDTWVFTLQDSDGTCSINPESGGLSTACVSDARLKSNIVDAKPMLDTLLATKIRDYTVNASGDQMTGTIAQEMQVSNPDMVVQGDDGYLRVKEFSSWQIIKGIQEVYRSLTDQIIALQNQVNSQQNNNSNNIISPVANSDLIIDLSPEQSASRLVIKGINDEEVASIDAQGKVTANNLEINNDATVSGTLYADNIESQRLEDIEELLREVELNQGLLAESQTWETNPSADSAEFASLIASSLQTNDLFVTGQAAISSLFVSDLLTANKIESLDMPLQIQSLAAAPLEIMAGKIIIDTNGNTKFLGNVEIAGDLKINNIIVANNVDPLATESGSIIEGQVVSNSTAGKATLKANSESIKINNNKVSLNTLIYITPITSTQNKVLYVKSKDTGFFEVGFSDTLDSDVEFNWWIIDLEGNTIIE